MWALYYFYKLGLPAMQTKAIQTLHGISPSVHTLTIVRSNYVQIQFLYHLFQIQCTFLDSHFWHGGKQTGRETKHRVPPALSAMGGQSSLVRLPPLDYPYPYHVILYSYTLLWHGGGKFLLFYNIRWWGAWAEFWANLSRGRADPSRPRPRVLIILVYGVWHKHRVEKVFIQVSFDWPITIRFLLCHCLLKQPKNLHDVTVQDSEIQIL